MGESFGRTLRQQRIARGLTQEALAERASLSATAIAALERGRNRAPRLSTLRQLGRALDLSQEDLAAWARMVSTDEPATVDAPVVESALAPDLPAPATRATVVDGAATMAPAPEVPPGRKTTIPLPPAAARRWRTDFVGRVAESDHLRRAWARGCRVTEVVGEAGIGKTRLVTELVRSLPAGTTTLWGRCSQDRLGSYLPFVEILRHVVAEADADSLRRAVGGRGELTRLVPEVVDRIGPLPAPARAEADSEQRMLFEAVSGLLANFSPLVLVIDDLHWADGATMSLLGYLVRDHTLVEFVTVITARPSSLDPVTSGLLAEMARHVDVARVRLHGLAGADLGHLVSDLVGAPATPELVESVAAATEGNPFFAEEMTLHLVDTEMIVDEGGKIVLLGDTDQAGVPERVRDTVVKRLLSLSADGMELLSVGAVIGREFDLPVAASASGLSGPRLIDAADDALLSGMVVETRPGRLAFSHALLRDAVNARLSHARRASVHRQVATAIEAQWPSSPEMAAELARHWAVVAEVDPAAVVPAAMWAVRAGDAALAAAAADEAIVRYEQASSLWATATSGHVDALIRLGVALQYRGRAEDADIRFRQATQLAIALGDTTLQARAAIGLGRRYPYWETDQARLGSLEAALAVLPEGEEDLRVVLMGLVVTHLINGFEADQAQRRDDLADELAAIAADSRTPPDRLLAIGQTRVYDCIEDPVTLRRVADRLLAVAQLHNDLRVEAGARFAQGLSSLDLGDMKTLAAMSEHYSEVSARLGDPRERSQAAMVRSTTAFIQGRYDDAEALSEEALQLGQASGDFNAELLHYAQGLLRAVDQGLAQDVLPLLIASTEYQHIASFDAGTALVAALAGDRDTAGAGLKRLVASGFQGAPRGADWLAPTAFLAHACALIGARDEAPALYDSLSRTAATAVRVGPHGRLVGAGRPSPGLLGLADRPARRGRTAAPSRPAGRGPDGRPAVRGQDTGPVGVRAGRECPPGRPRRRRRRHGDSQGRWGVRGDSGSGDGAGGGPLTGRTTPRRPLPENVLHSLYLTLGRCRISGSR